MPDLLAAEGDERARVDRIAAALSRSLAERPVFCDLLSAQAAVLERNVSPEIAARYKRASLASVAALAAIVRDRLPELDEAASRNLCSAMVIAAGAVWSHAHPSAAMREAYERAPDLAACALDFQETLRDMIATLVSGTLARAADR